MKKKLLTLTLIFVMVMALAACGNKDSGGGGSAEGGVSANSDITILDYADLSSLYPLDMGTQSDTQPMFLLYDSLLRLSPDQEYIWMLAESCQASEDGLEYTFKLREGISFSDGTPWNAEAAKANLDVMADQSLGYNSQYLFSCIDSTEIVDEYTIKVTLKEVYAPFLNALATESACMVSPKSLEAGREVLASQPVGTGQYTLVERKAGEYTKLALNRDWWGYDAEICGGEPLVAEDCGFNSITIRPITEEATRVAMLQNGEADIINQFSHVNQTVVENSGNHILKKTGSQIAYVYFNCQKDVFQDARVRQAISMAIDLDALNEVVYGNNYAKPNSFMTEVMKYYKAFDPIKYDPEAAKALLAEAGYGNGLTLVAWEENDTTDVQRGEFIQQQLAEVGIDLKIYPQEGGFLTDNVNAYSGDPAKTEWDIYIRGYAADTADADEMVGRFSTGAFPPAGSNYSFYSNKEFDKWIEQGASTLDEDVRSEAYANAQEILWNDMPAIPTLSACYIAGYNDHIEGLDFGTAGSFFLMNAKYVE